MTNRFASRVAAVAAAALIGIAGVSARAASHGHRGHHGGGDFVIGHRGARSRQLNLNTSQQAMWDNAVAAGKAARESARANMQKVHDALTAELAKAEPDLAAVAAAADDARERERGRRNARCATRGSISTARSRRSRRRS